jgi:HEAT repeat protein
LPPVEAPSARFILQLFVVPAVIVAAVVLLWLVIESLARRDEGDVDEIVRTIGSSSQARFQKAHDLANMLNVPERYTKLITNRDAARQLGDVLEKEVETASDSDASVYMRFYLTQALGRFRVEDGLPALVNTARGDPNRDVRQLAIQSIGMTLKELGGLNPPEPVKNEATVEGLLALGDEPDEVFRGEGAYLLGLAATPVGADPRLTEKLVELADDPTTDARFNAATALARLGHPRAGQAVAEMFDAESIASSVAGLKPAAGESNLKASQAAKRNSILNNALAAVELLLEKKALSPDDRSALEKALADFVAAAPSVREPMPIPDSIAGAAKRTLDKLRASQGVAKQSK